MAELKWIILLRYTGYNIADLVKSGTADKLTHLIYAFGNVTATATPACAISDPLAAYQDPTASQRERQGIYRAAL
jgi:hypothetical protein